MKKTAVFHAILVLLFFNCAGFDRMVMLTLMELYPSRMRTVRLSDGYEAAYYTFTLGDKKKTDTVMFAVWGSGHASVQLFRFLLKDMPGHVRVFALQKRHVPHNGTDFDEPSRDYFENDMPSRRTADQVEFIRRVLSDDANRKNRIVLFGASEGGTIAPAIAVQIPEITHVAVLGDGGMKGLDSFRIWGRKHGVDFDALYEKVTKNPATDRFVLGCTYRYWKEMLQTDPMAGLAGLDIPLFYAMGSKDESVPLESLFYLQSRFAELKKGNLTVKVYDGCNHELEDEKGDSRLKEYSADLHEWLSRN
jgi:pimeloyl-ACP methyl ester carboxylesterase